MLQFSLFPPHATALQVIPKRDRVGTIKAEIVRFLRALHDQVIATYSKLWQEDSFQLGAFAAAQPGQLSWSLSAS